MAGYLAGNVDKWIYIDILTSTRIVFDLSKIVRKQSEKRSRYYDQKSTAV